MNRTTTIVVALIAAVQLNLLSLTNSPIYRSKDGFVSITGNYGIDIHFFGMIEINFPELFMSCNMHYT